jgi:hypothetical protein
MLNSSNFYTLNVYSREYFQVFNFKTVPVTYTYFWNIQQNSIKCWKVMSKINSLEKENL